MDNLYFLQKCINTFHIIYFVKTSFIPSFHLKKKKQSLCELTIFQWRVKEVKMSVVESYKKANYETTINKQIIMLNYYKLHVLSHPGSEAIQTLLITLLSHNTWKQVKLIMETVKSIVYSWSSNKHVSSSRHRQLCYCMWTVNMDHLIPQGLDQQ